MRPFTHMQSSKDNESICHRLLKANSQAEHIQNNHQAEKAAGRCTCWTNRLLILEVKKTY